MDIFTCGVCQKEFNSIKEFYNHKLQNPDIHKCLDCEGIQFHDKSQLKSHQKECHIPNLNACVSKDTSGQTQIDAIVTGDCNLELDSNILEKLIEISSTGNNENIHIILDVSKNDVKESNDVECVLIQNPVKEKEAGDTSVIEATSFYNNIFVCKVCNHFSYLNKDVISHINQIHRHLIDDKSSNLENLIQKLELLPCNESKQDASQNNKVISVQPVERLLSTPVPVLNKYEDKTGSKSLNKKINPKYCVDCKSYFKDLVHLKTHACSVRSTLSVDCNIEAPNCKDTNSKVCSSNKKMKTCHFKGSDKDCVFTNQILNSSKTENDDDLNKLDWEKVDLDKEAVLARVDHLFTEAGDKQEFSCIICGKAFIKKLEIREHCLTHTNLKPYRCCVCKYATKVKSLLVKHLKSHCRSKSDEKCDNVKASEEFQCKLCLEKCDNLKSLVIHVRKIHDNVKGYETLLSLTCEKVEDENHVIKFRCFFCYVSFVHENECMDHLKSQHLKIDSQSDIPDLVVKIWKCQLCNHTTSYPKSYLRHISKHKIIFTCSICKCNLLSFAQLNEHLSNHANCGEEDEKLYKIKELIQRSLDISWYLPEEVTKQIDVVVNKASQKLRNEDELKLDLLIKFLKYKQLSFDTYDHIKQCLGNVECQHCGRLFFTSAELKRHDGIHAIEKEHKCHLCEYSAATKNNLTRHIAKIHEKKVLHCSDCDFTTMCLTSLWSHKKSHQKQIECTECRKQFPKLKLLRQHVIDCHLKCVKLEDELEGSKKGIGNSSFKCPHCSRQFHRSIREFKRHMWIHEGVKPIKCTLCSYRCRTSNHLEIHMRKHSNVKAFQCPECLKDFKSKSSVQNHIQRFHSSEKTIMHACDKCEYKTAQKGHLKLHQRNHLLVRNFSCQLCMYSSNTLSSLKGHYKKKHKGKEFEINEDKNNCAEGKAIVQATHTETSNLDSTNSQVEIRVFKCDTCDYRFTSVSEFRRHLKVKHGLINFKWGEVEVKVTI